MAKIRGVKPETWTDDKFVQLTPLARLMFIGMWNLACDNGHVEDNAVQLKMRLLPMDACDPAELIDEMVQLGQVERTPGWLKVTNLVQHQRAPDKRFLTLCERCAHDEHVEYMDADRLPRSPSTRRAPNEHTPSTRRAHAGEGEGEGPREAPATKPKRATKLPASWQPNDAHRALAAERGVDVNLEAEKMRDWAAAKGATGKDWDARFRNWLRDARPSNNVHPIRRDEGHFQPFTPPLAPPEIADDPAAYQRFVQEAAAKWREEHGL